MAQIIKHRRGSIATLKGTTARNGELIIASGSISDLGGPFVFVGSPNSTDEGVAGAFKAVSKIYAGSSAPTIGAATYGSILDGTPFYASGNKSLYILNNDGAGGNSRMDFTGNIEGNTISNVTITSLTGSNANYSNLTGTTFTSTNSNITSLTGSNANITNITGSTISGSYGRIVNDLSVGGNTTLVGQTSIKNDLYITGNTYQTGSINITGNISLGGNISIGDQNTDFITFGGEVSSSIVPDINNAFDLGSPTKNWRDIYVSGTAFVDVLQARQVNFSDLGILNNLSVSGSTFLGNGGDITVVSGSAYFDTLTNTRLTFAGTNGVLTDSADLTYNGTQLNVGQGKFTVQKGSGNVLTQGNVSVEGNLIVTGTTLVSGATTIDDTLRVTSNSSLEGTLTVTGATELKSTLIVSGATTIDDTLRVTDNSSLEGTLTVTGATSLKNTLTVTGTTTINGDEVVNGVLTVTGNTQLGGNLYVSGNLEVLGTSTNVNIQSNTVSIDDNIIRLNAYSPFQRYAGIEVMDSGSSGVSASMVWDSLNDYWMFVSSSGATSKFVGTTAGSYGSENSLTANKIAKGTGLNTIGDSLLSDDGTTLAYNTNKFTVASGDGATLIAGNVTLSSVGGSDANSKTSAVVFKNSSNVLGYVSTTETTDVLDGVLGYKHSNGGLVFSTVIDGGTY